MKVKESLTAPALYNSQSSHDLSFFLQKEQAPISPQIRFVMFQFLFTSKCSHRPRNLGTVSQVFCFFQAVKPMTSDFLTKSVLELIFKRAEIKECRRSGNHSAEYLYEYGKGCNYFILILSGEATIEVGKEKLEFPAGPFAYFGVNALLCACDTADQVLQQADQQKLLHATSSPSVAAARATAGIKSSVTMTPPTFAKQQRAHTYVPDFSLRVDDRCVYMKLDRELWLNGVIKSRLEKQNNRASEAIELTSHEMEARQATTPQPRLNLALETPTLHRGPVSARPPTVAASAFAKVQQAAKMQQTGLLPYQSPKPLSQNSGYPVSTTEETASQLDAEEVERQPFLKRL